MGLHRQIVRHLVAICGAFVVAFAFAPPTAFASANACTELFKEPDHAARHLISAFDSVAQTKTSLRHRTKELIARFAKIDTTLDPETLRLMAVPVDANIQSFAVRAKVLERTLEKSHRDRDLRDLREVEAAVEKWRAQFNQTPSYVNLLSVARASVAGHSFALSLTGIETRSVFATKSPREIAYHSALAPDLVMEKTILSSALKKKMLVPFADDLTIYDFNRLVGTGIAPVGLITGVVKVDGTLLDPLRFFGHDMGHALVGMVARMSPADRARWVQFLDRIDEQPARERDLLHVWCFYLTHENTRPVNPFNTAPLKAQLKDATVSTLLYRMNQESAFGVANLEQNPPTHEELQSALQHYIELLKP